MLQLIKLLLDKMIIKKFLPGIIWFVIIIVLLLLPSRDFPSTGGWFKDLPTDKIVHFGIFGTLTFLFLRPAPFLNLSKRNKEIYLLFIVFISILWGITTEYMQETLTTDRAFDLLDWAADSLGSIVAYLFYKIWYRKRY